MTITLEWGLGIVIEHLHREHAVCMYVCMSTCYSAPSRFLLRGAADYSANTESEFHAKAHEQLRVKDLPGSLRGGLTWIRTRNPPAARHRTYPYTTAPHCMWNLDWWTKKSHEKSLEMSVLEIEQRYLIIIYACSNVKILFTVLKLIIIWKTKIRSKINWELK